MVLLLLGCDIISLADGLLELWNSGRPEASGISGDNDLRPAIVVEDI